MSQPTERQESNSPEDSEREEQQAPGQFRFLTFTNITQATSRDTRRRVRSHAMHRVQRSLRERRENERKVVLDISSLMQSGDSQTSMQQNQSTELVQSYLHALSDPRDLGSGRSDPFRQYPIEMDVRKRELFDHRKHLSHCQ